MYCPKCLSQILAEDANLSTLVARCRACQEVFRFEDQLKPPSPATPEVRRAECPPNIVVESAQDGTMKRISIPSATGKAFAAIFLFLVLLVADVMLLALGYNMFASGHVPWPVAISFGFMLLCWLFMTYVVLAGTQNTTVLEISDSLLLLRHVPMPWPGDRCLEIKNIQRIEFQQQSGWARGMVVHQFFVTAIDRAEKRLPLVQMTTPDSARFIAEQLQEWLTADRLPAPEAASVRPSEAIQTIR
jgi:hypothetical protein